MGKRPVQKVRGPSLIADFTPANETQAKIYQLLGKKFCLVNVNAGIRKNNSCFTQNSVSGAADKPAGKITFRM
jgi:hypothetical protein